MRQRSRGSSTSSERGRVFSIEVAGLAQLRADVGAEIGVMQRVAPDHDPGASVPLPGPSGELQAHVALLPMLRVGAYLSHDIVPGDTDRETTEAGLRAKVALPILPRPWRAWPFLGLGAARSYRPSHALAPTSTAAGGEVGGVEGGFLDATLGLGVGVKFRDDWVAFAELAAHSGFFFWGDMYDHAPCACLRDPYPGHDSFAASLRVGVSLDL